MAYDSAGIGQTSIFLAEIHMTSEYLSNELAQLFGMRDFP